MKMNSKKKRRIWMGLGMGVILTLVSLILVPRPVEVETVRVSRGLFVETIRADGVLRSRERQIVTAFADGETQRVSLKVGDTVARNQVITRLFWDVRWDPVRSPFRGVISKVFRESAGPIRRGEAIVEVVDPDQLEVVTELLTTDATRVSPGNPAVVKGFGAEGELKATVSRVSRAGFTKTSALGVEEEKTEVTLELPRIPQEVSHRLGSSFHVEVTIQVAEAQNVLKLPVGAIFREGAGWAVYRTDSGRARVAPIKIKARSNEEVWLEGLNEGDPIILFPGDLVKEGTRIKALEKR